jgi:GntR family transcriptional regulator / MocR family aminotransferase
VLLDAGDGVVMEEPHYPGARLVFEAAGARLTGVPVDGDGLDTTKLPGPAAGVRLACERRAISSRPASSCPSAGARICWTGRRARAPGSWKTIT